MRRSPQNLFLPLILVLLMAGCGKSGEVPVSLNGVFNPVDTAFRATSLVIPGGDYAYKVLFREGDPVRVAWRDTLAPAKGRHDYLAYLPIDGQSNHGILWCNHEDTTPHDLIGDGGGATVMEVFRDSVRGWQLVGYPHAVDFGPVGGTLHNCLGGVTPWNTVLTSEEIEPGRNKDLNAGPGLAMMRDTSDVDGMPRWKNIGWMVEVDPYQRKALHKLYAMGRFMHEGNYCMPDKKTVYMMDDSGPGVFFKFVADKPGDYRAGTLYAYQQSEDGKGGNWLALSRDRDTLTYARRHALEMGATVFIRLEDIELHKDGTFFITETGKDSCDLSGAIGLGGRVAAHLSPLHVGNGIYDDRHGRILRFDPNTNRLYVYLEAGAGKEDQSIHLANPDNLALDTRRNMLVIHEDINALSAGRVAAGTRDLINEIYFLDVSNPQPTVDDLQRFAVGPIGSETTGPAYTPDLRTLFLNIQHPSPANPPPFDRSCTVVVTGFPE